MYLEYNDCVNNYVHIYSDIYIKGRISETRISTCSTNLLYIYIYIYAKYSTVDYRDTTFYLVSPTEYFNIVFNY